MRSTDGGLNVAFSNLSGDAISDLDVSLTTLRMPSSCPTTPANVTLTADASQHHGAADRHRVQRLRPTSRR